MGLTSYLFLIVFGRSTSLPECPVVGNLPIPFLSAIPLMGNIFFNQDIFVYFMLFVVVILGKRNPLMVLLDALLIGAADALQFRIQTLGSPVPSQFFIMLPYVITVLVLLFSAGKSNTPNALGTPFIRSKR